MDDLKIGDIFYIMCLYYLRLLRWVSIIVLSSDISVEYCWFCVLHEEQYTYLVLLGVAVCVNLLYTYATHYYKKYIE